MVGRLQNSQGQAVGINMSEEGDLGTVPGCGAPLSFKNQTSLYREFYIAKGQINEFSLRPKIVNENVMINANSGYPMALVTPTQIVMQIIKASHDNIAGLQTVLAVTGDASIDNFESYADDAELRAVWQGTDDDPDLSSNSYIGDASMQLDFGTYGNEVTKSFAATNYASAEFTMLYQQSGSYGRSEMQFFISDGTNSKSWDLVINEQNAWVLFDFVEEDATEDSGGTTDVSAITSMGFRVADSHNNSRGYVDQISSSNASGSIQTELWDMGESFPVSGSTALNDGNQYQAIGDADISSTLMSSVTTQLRDGRHIYEINDFICGVAPGHPDNELLIPGNYYAIVFRYIDVPVTLYGPDPRKEVNRYVNGFAATAADNDTAIESLGNYHDLTFGIFSTQDCYITAISKTHDEVASANSSDIVYTLDSTGLVDNVLNNFSMNPISADIKFNNRWYMIPKGGRFVVQYDDDATDDTTVLRLFIGYVMEDPECNG